MDFEIVKHINKKLEVYHKELLHHNLFNDEIGCTIVKHEIKGYLQALDDLRIISPTTKSKLYEFTVDVTRQ